MSLDVGLVAAGNAVAPDDCEIDDVTTDDAPVDVGADVGVVVGIEVAGVVVAGVVVVAVVCTAFVAVLCDVTGTVVWTFALEKSAGSDI
jgi:hypothetical protein